MHTHACMYVYVYICIYKGSRSHPSILCIWPQEEEGSHHLKQAVLQLGTLAHPAAFLISLVRASFFEPEIFVFPVFGPQMTSWCFL